MKIYKFRSGGRALAVLLVFYLFTSGLSSQHHVPLDQWVRDYAKDLSKPDWKKYVVKYGWDSDYENHEAFRNAFRNVHADVMRSVTDGTYVMSWMKVSADWEGNVPDSELREAEPTGKRIEWEEVWYFDVIDGKFGTKWDILGDDVSKMKSAGVRCLPAK